MIHNTYVTLLDLSYQKKEHVKSNNHTAIGRRVQNRVPKPQIRARQTGQPGLLWIFRRRSFRPTFLKPGANSIKKLQVQFFFTTAECACKCSTYNWLNPIEYHCKYKLEASNGKLWRLLVDSNWCEFVKRRVRLVKWTGRIVDFCLIGFDKGSYTCEWQSSLWR